MKHLLLYSLAFVALIGLQNDALAQGSSKVTFNGAARGVILADQYQGGDTIPDTVTARNLQSGHTLVDLGLNIRPNDHTEIQTVLRIRNDYGGFWGSGVSFDVRQLYARGILGNVVRYQVGDINYKLTPFTFYNTEEELAANEPTIFKVYRDMANYDNFYNDNNTWRQQGAAADFGLEFKKGIKELRFSGFTSRIAGINGPGFIQSLIAGGNVSILQSKYANVGVNYMNAFELVNNAEVDPNQQNRVISGNFEFTWENDNLKARLLGEAGQSHSWTRNDSLAADLEDTFLEAGIALKHKPTNIELTLGYRDVGPDFRSVGAQTKRINYLAQAGAYQRYTSDQITRPVSMMDLMRDGSLYNRQLSTDLMAYSPIYGNAMPYGVATPNRTGLFAKAKYAMPKDKLIATVEVNMLDEIRGQGTFELRTYNHIQSNLVVNINKFMENYDRKLKVTAGMRMESAKRSGAQEFEKIELTSNLIDLGAEIELVEKFDLLFGMRLFTSEGFEYLPVRDAATQEVIFFSELDVSMAETMTGAGVRYRFKENTFLTLQWQAFQWEDKLNNFADYDFNQFGIIYSMKF